MKEKIKNYWNKFKDWNINMYNNHTFWYGAISALVLVLLWKIIF